MNRRGPRTEPWGTPEVTGGLRGEGIELDELVDRWEMNRTQWGVCDRPMGDYCLLRNMVWDIVSRAAVRSRMMRMVRVEFSRNGFFFLKDFGEEGKAGLRVEIIEVVWVLTRFFHDLSSSCSIHPSSVFTATVLFLHYSVKGSLRVLNLDRSNLGTCQIPAPSTAIVLAPDDIKRLLMLFGNTRWGNNLGSNWDNYHQVLLWTLGQTLASTAPKDVVFFSQGCKTGWARMQILMAANVKADVGFLASLRWLCTPFVTINVHPRFCGSSVSQRALGLTFHRGPNSFLMSVVFQLMNSWSLKNSLDIVFLCGQLRKRHLRYSTLFVLH